MRTQKLRVGVIGAGSWAVASHIPNLRRRAEDVDLVAVCRLGASELEAIRSRFDFHVASERYCDVLAQDLDVCVVASPAALHYEHAAAALNSGAHVLLEKPITIDSTDAWDLVRIARTRSRHIVCAFGWNYNEITIAAVSALQAHGIGQIEHINVQMSSGVRELLLGAPYYGSSDSAVKPKAVTWTDPEMSGGGYAQAQLPHALAALFALHPTRARWVFGANWTPRGSSTDSPIELHNAAVITFADGSIGSLGGASRPRACQRRHGLVLELTGSRGTVRVDLNRDELYVGDGDEASTRTFPPGTGVYECRGPIDTVVDLALGKDVPNRSNGELGARTVETIEALYRSARSNRISDIDVR